jgi:hypothetical protein
VILRFLIILLACGVSVSVSQDQPLFREIIPEQITAVGRGLDYLARKQNRDGSWDSGNYRMHPGITALACLAFMAGGHLPHEGTYADTVRRGLNFILKSTGKNGLIQNGITSHPMYGHGYATLFLAEIYGMTGDHDIKPHLERAIGLILRSQKADGGWRYTADPRGSSDISITVVQLKALRAARNSGINIDAGVIKKAVTYITDSVCEDGGFAYTLQHRRSGFARTAAGVTSLYIAGEYKGKAIDGALAFLNTRRRENSVLHWYYYGNFYAAQAMFQAGGDYWEDWFPWIRENLIKLQTRDGAWLQHSSAGPVFATAMAVMILEIPYRYLPIFQR